MSGDIQLQSLVRPVTALLIAASILMMGNGLLSLLLPLRAGVESFSRLEIGFMGSCYYAGLMAGCAIAPIAMARVGHARAFTAFTASATATPLLHAIVVDPWGWSALRFLNGLCFAGLFMGIESWLAGASETATRGRVLALYTLINLTVVTLGMQMTGVISPEGFQLFSVVAILYSIAAVPIALATTPAPHLPKQARLRLGWLVSVSPAAVAGCFFTGIANSGFWTLAPVYAHDAGMSVNGIATFMTTAVLCGAASQWPTGQISDRMGRRPLLITTAIGAATAGILLFLEFGRGRLFEYVLAGAYGMMAFPVYTLCVAHANDLVSAKRRVEVSSGLLLVFSIGAVVGPMMASSLMAVAGSGAVFLSSCLAHISIAATMLARLSLRPSLPVLIGRKGFVVVPKTTPAVFELDPRGTPTQGQGPKSGTGEGDHGQPQKSAA